MEELDKFIKFQYETAAHFRNSLKTIDNHPSQKALHERLWFLNRLTQLSEIVKSQLIENQQNKSI